jgi:hypothetical protein
MAKTKDKNSSNFHISKTNYPKNSEGRKTPDFARLATIIIIVLAMVIVAGTILVFYFTNPERTTKWRIEAIAADYYENYFYPEFVSSNDKPLEEKMEPFKVLGFSSRTLRDLVLFDNGRYINDMQNLTKYCDEESTTVHFTPVSPYGKKDYTVDYRYSCVF